MKLKNLFTTLGLAAVLGIGAGIGLTAQENSKEAKADTVITSVQLRGSFDSWGSGVDFEVDENGDYSLTYSLSENTEFKIRVTGGKEEWVGYNWGISGDNIDYTLVGEGSDGNFKALSANSFVFTVKSTFYTNYGTDVTIQKNASLTHDVGFDEDNDGTADVIVPVVDGETVPFYSPYKFGKTFDTWNLGDNAFDFDTPITEDLLLSAVWTDREGELDYIYVITGYGADWSTRYIYGYGDTEGYGTWKGALLTDIVVGVTKTANFGGGNDQYLNGGIYKVPFYTEDYMSNIILHNDGGDDRSGDLPFGQGYGYFFKNNPWNDEGGCFDEEKMMSVGFAAKYVYEFDEILSGEDFCKLDPEVCAELWNNYREIARDDEYIDGWISSSCINTANGGDNVPLSVILPELKKIAERNGQYVEESMMKNSLNADSETTIIIVVIAAFIAISTFGVCLVIKRRKQFNK